MKRLSYLLAVVAISGFALMPTSSSASPLAIGLAFDSATLPGLNEGLLQKVQVGSCREKQMDWTAQQRHDCRDYHKQQSKRRAKPKKTKK